MRFNVGNTLNLRNSDGDHNEIESKFQGEFHVKPPMDCTVETPTNTPHIQLPYGF